ncbi:MAG: hypothetical protein GY870_18440 [archaeon]|nr:hypothetical protein [archaeon]
MAKATKKITISKRNIKKTTAKKGSKKKRSTKKADSKPKQGDGEIKEASIAKFMRKRTQLVGFDFGLHKHTQYAVEFADNALDAIEKFQWDQGTALHELRNKMGRASMEFSRYDRDLEKLIGRVEKNAPKKELVNKLKQLIENSGPIFKKISEVYWELQSRIGLSSGSSTDAIEHSKKIVDKILDIKVTSSNFQEEYDNFIKEYGYIKKDYDQFSIQINKLEADPRFMLTLEQEMTLENFSYYDYLLRETSGNGLDSENESENLEESSILKNTEIEISDDDSAISELKKQIAKEEEDEIDDEQARELRKLKKDKKELEEEVQNLVNSLEGFLKSVINIVDKEPIIIIKIKEDEAPDVFKEKGGRSGESFLYTFEIFDNGTGMPPGDLLKYGKYLASSKSQKLKQTRGSQGFGSPSAFSDAQNTTGRPVTVISKHSSQIYGVASEFYTTDKNTKVYVVPPTEIECGFLHGTYCKLQYLNKQYKRGYVDSYMEKTAMMNSHVTIIFIDPYDKEHVFPRRVNFFPKEPKYALPHPSSIKLGDFQDLLRASTNLTVSAFLTDSFIRMSNALAKSIVKEAEFEIERNLEYLNLEVGFLSVIKKETEDLQYIREEQRIYGRSPKPRPIKVVYSITDSETKELLWKQLKGYNNTLKERNNVEKKIRTIDKTLIKEKDKKILKQKEKEIKLLEKEINSKIKDMEFYKKALKKEIKNIKLSEEISDLKIIDKTVEITDELMISKTKPASLTQAQTESLYMAFKNQKYMAPPTDTAIPVGESALETAIIKQYGLIISNRVDFFGNSEFGHIKQIGDFERENLINKILSKFNNQGLFSQNVRTEKILSYETDLNFQIYSNIIEEIDLVHTTGDDFIASHTRKPTSGKGLAFVVEAVVAYSPDRIPSAKKAASVVSRYVNRTPKLRDNSDCALWMGIQNVKWKGYKVSETFDNGIPRGHYVIYINCSGPYTHLMFKSQSKNALAEDEALLKEVKFCLEVIGRKLRSYMGKKEVRKQKKDRAEKIRKNIPIFIESLHNITKQIPKFKDLKKKTLIDRIQEALMEEKTQLKKKKITSEESKSQLTVEELQKRAVQLKEAQSKKPSMIATVVETARIKAAEMSESAKIQNKITKTQIKTTKKPITVKTREKTGATTSELTNPKIIDALASEVKWYTTSDLVKKLGIKTMMDARFLQIKLQALRSKGLIISGKKGEKKVWKIK